MDVAKERVEKERDELDIKLKSLGDFFESEKCSALSAEMQMLLHKQFRAMYEYHQILTRRLEIWDRPALPIYEPTAYCPKCRRVFAEGEWLCDCGVPIVRIAIVKG